ncbi:hypothetical protein CALCODRAFT_546488 [Calocera cornea HHB12733]|uniref:Uncharacterized protein n=1 Tax=Calocera cornea HHB12733 TaxID=1353952 RepID=A0A165EN10_9BASI|nr:hypothetical protein CALCODRAFT_546488 [Calocera cornea HHB12733]
MSAPMTRNLGRLLKQLNRLVEATPSLTNGNETAVAPSEYQFTLPLNFLPVERMSAASLTHCPLYENLEPLSLEQFDKEFWQMKVYAAANAAHETEEDRSKAVCCALGLLYAVFDEESVCTMDSAFNQIAMGFLNSAVAFIRQGSTRLKDCLPDIVNIPCHIREEHIECYEYSEAQMMDETRGHIRAVKSRVLKTSSKRTPIRHDLPTQDQSDSGAEAVETIRQGVRFGAMTKEHDGGPDLQKEYSERKRKGKAVDLTELERVASPELDGQVADPPNVDDTEEETLSSMVSGEYLDDRRAAETIALSPLQTMTNRENIDETSVQLGGHSLSTVHAGSEASAAQQASVRDLLSIIDGEKERSVESRIDSTDTDVEKTAQNNEQPSISIDDRPSLSPPSWDMHAMPTWPNILEGPSACHGSRSGPPLPWDPISTSTASVDDYNQANVISDDGRTGEDDTGDVSGWNDDDNAFNESGWPANHVGSTPQRDPLSTEVGEGHAISLSTPNRGLSSSGRSDLPLQLEGTVGSLDAVSSDVAEERAHGELSSSTGSRKRTRSERSDTETDGALEDKILPRKDPYRSHTPSSDSQSASTASESQVQSIANKPLENYYVAVESHPRKQHMYYKRGVFTGRTIISLQIVKSEAGLRAWTAKDGRNIGERIVPKDVPLSQLSAKIVSAPQTTHAKGILAEESKEYEMCDKPRKGKKRAVPYKIYDDVDGNPQEGEPLQSDEEHNGERDVEMESDEDEDVIRYLPGEGAPCTSWSVAEVRQLKLDLLGLTPSVRLCRADKAVQRRKLSRANERQGIGRDPSKDRFCKKTTKKANK